MPARKNICFFRILSAVKAAIFGLAVVMSGAALAIAGEQSPQTPEAIEKLVKVGEYSLNFRIIPGQGPAILLESGGGMDSTEWAALAPRLARETGATVIAYDRAGFGKSDLPETQYDLHEDTEALWRGLQQLGLDQNLILVGHSYGGFLIRFEAGEHPGSVKGLVFVDPFTVEFVDAMGIEACNNHPMMGKLPFDASNPEKLTKYQRAAVRMVGAPNSNLAEKCAAMRKTVLPRGLPVRVITSGTNWLSPEEQKIWRESHERLTASIEGAKLLVAEQSGHMIPFVQPDLVVTVVKEVVDENSHAQISKKAESIFASLVELRRDIHQHPELSGKETRTSALVKKYLIDLGLEVKTNIGGFGVVGILKGANPGPVVAWRADMDALADNSPDSVAFKSINPGVKHSCGHDVHTTIALGIANVLSSLKTKLKGTVLFIFEPSEENFLGAKAMLADGLFGQLKPDAILALHLGPLPAGTVAVKPEEMFACRTKITIGLKNLLNEEEALNICAGILNGLNTPRGLNIFSVPIDDSEKGLFNPQSPLTDFFALGNSPQIERQGNTGHAVEVRAFSSSLANVESAIGKLKEAFGSSKLKDNVQTVEYAFLQPPVYNDPELTAKSFEIIQALYGKSCIVPLYGVLPGFNDDFAFFQKEIKGVYFFLGGSNFEKGVVSMPHAPNFEVDESCIKSGTAIFSSLIFELTGN